MAGGTAPLRIYLDEGRKKTFAVALEWPGWARSGRTAEAAIDALRAYLPRFAPVVRRAGLELPPADAAVEIVERVPGTSTTDFGALGNAPKADLEPLEPGEPERLAALVAAAWEVFDDVATTAPAELRKGPRGGGRNRDEIVAHVVGAEAGYLHQLGIKASTTRGRSRTEARGDPRSPSPCSSHVLLPRAPPTCCARCSSQALQGLRTGSSQVRRELSEGSGTPSVKECTAWSGGASLPAGGYRLRRVRER